MARRAELEKNVPKTVIDDIEDIKCKINIQRTVTDMNKILKLVVKYSCKTVFKYSIIVLHAWDFFERGIF